MIAVWLLYPAQCVAEEHHALAEDKFSDCEAVLWTRLVSVEKNADGLDVTQYEIVAIGRDSSRLYKVGQRIALTRKRTSDTKTMYLLLKDEELLQENIEETQWDIVGPLEPETWDFIVNAPSSNTPDDELLRYHFKYLRSTEPYIQEIAHHVFETASYEGHLKTKGLINRETIREWLSDQHTPEYRWSAYGILLGINGNETDAEFLISMIDRPTKDYRIYLHGFIAGYLLLTGEQGIEKIEEIVFSSKEASFADIYEAMQAIDFLLETPPKNLPRERLLTALRIPLTRPEMADLVISRLRTANDWTMLDELMHLYENDEFDQPNIKREIVRYLWSCAHSWDGKVDSELPDYVSTAKKALEKIEQSDPKIYQQAVRVFHLRQENK